MLEEPSERLWLGGSKDYRGGASYDVTLDPTSCERVLVVENEGDAGPEMLQHWLRGAGLELDIWRPYAGEVLPRGVGEGALLVLGGEMGAYEDHRAPWLAEVRTLLAQATNAGAPVLGVCLGAQLLAATCGGRVEASKSGGELGLSRVELTDEALRDPLFSGMPTPVEVVQWHNDEIVELPPGAVLLASSELCPVQAYRIGTRAWGVQFHPEVDATVLKRWAEAESPPTPGRQRTLRDAVVAVAAAESRLFQSWKAFAERFAAVVRNR